MIARITRILLLAQLAVAILVALAIMNRWPQLPVIPAALFGVDVVLLLRAGIVANNFRIASRFSCDPPRAVAAASALLQMFLGELRATLVSSSWHMPFCRLDPAPTVCGGGLPVLLVHGYGCNSGYWQPMAREFRAAGISFHAVDLEPVLGDIDGYLPQVSRAIDILRAATKASQVVIVAHSMGGLVARAWLSENGWQKVTKLITLGTPHQGTGLAQFGIGKNAAQMCSNDNPADPACNPWLARLNSVPDQRRERIVSLYSTQDNIIAPATSACLPGATNIAFACIGHVALASTASVISCVIDFVRQANASAHGDERDRSGNENSAPGPGNAAIAVQSISIQEKPSS